MAKAEDEVRWQDVIDAFKSTLARWLPEKTEIEAQNLSFETAMSDLEAFIKGLRVEIDSSELGSVSEDSVDKVAAGDAAADERPAFQESVDTGSLESSLLDIMREAGETFLTAIREASSLVSDKDLAGGLKNYATRHHVYDEIKDDIPSNLAELSEDEGRGVVGSLYMKIDELAAEKGRIRRKENDRKTTIEDALTTGVITDEDVARLTDENGKLDKEALLNQIEKTGLIIEQIRKTNLPYSSHKITQASLKATRDKDVTLFDFETEILPKALEAWQPYKLKTKRAQNKALVGRRRDEWLDAQIALSQERGYSRYTPTQMEVLRREASSEGYLVYKAEYDRQYSNKIRRASALLNNKITKSQYESLDVTSENFSGELQKAAGDAAALRQSLKALAGRLDQFKLFDPSRLTMEKSRQVGAAGSLVQGLVPSFIPSSARAQIGYATTGIQTVLNAQAVNESFWHKWLQRGTSLAPAIGQFAGSLMGGSLGGMVGNAAGMGVQGLIGLGSTILGENKQRQIQLAGLDRQNNLSAIGMIWSYMLLPLQLAGGALRLFTRGLRGTLNVFTGFMRIGRLGLDELGSLGTPLTHLTGMGYGAYQGSQIADKLFGVSSGTVNRDIEQWQLGVEGFMRLGKFNEDALIAASIAGLLPQLYMSRERGVEGYGGLVDTAASAVVGKDDKQKTYYMSLLSMMGGNLAHYVQVLSDLREYAATEAAPDDLKEAAKGGLKFKDLLNPAKLGVYYRAIESPERNQMRWVNAQYQGVMSSFSNSRMRMGTALWDVGGKNVANIFNKAFDKLVNTLQEKSETIAGWLEKPIAWLEKTVMHVANLDLEGLKGDFGELWQGVKDKFNEWKPKVLAELETWLPVVKGFFLKVGLSFLDTLEGWLPKITKLWDEMVIHLLESVNSLLVELSHIRVKFDWKKQKFDFYDDRNNENHVKKYGWDIPEWSELFSDKAATNLSQWFSPLAVAGDPYAALVSHAFNPTQKIAPKDKEKLLAGVVGYAGTTAENAVIVEQARKDAFNAFNKVAGKNYDRETVEAAAEQIRASYSTPEDRISAFTQWLDKALPNKQEGGAGELDFKRAAQGYAETYFAGGNDALFVDYITQSGYNIIKETMRDGIAGSLFFNLQSRDAKDKTADAFFKEIFSLDLSQFESLEKLQSHLYATYGKSADKYKGLSADEIAANTSTYEKSEEFFNAIGRLLYMRHDIKGYIGKIDEQNLVKPMIEAIRDTAEIRDELLMDLIKAVRLSAGESVEQIDKDMAEQKERLEQRREAQNEAYKQSISKNTTGEVSNTVSAEEGVVIGDKGVTVTGDAKVTLLVTDKTKGGVAVKVDHIQYLTEWVKSSEAGRSSLTG